MGWLSDIFGGGNKSKINNAYNAANDKITLGNTQANDFYNTGARNQLGAIGAGVNQARGDINSGYGSAITNFGAGIDAAKNAATTYGASAKAALSPWLTTGTAGQNAYAASLGLGPNGQSGVTDLQKQFTDANDPVFAAQRAHDLGALSAAANAKGQSLASSGRTTLAATRAMQQDAANRWQTYQAQLAGLGAQGQRASETSGQYDVHTGDILSQLESQRGQGIAALNTGQAGALSNVDTWGAGANAGIYGNQANNLANQANSYASTMAGNDINRNSAIMGDQQRGFQNMLGAAGTAISAAGMAMGVPPMPKFNYQPGTQANGGWSTMTQPSQQSWWNNLNPWGRT